MLIELSSLGAVLFLGPIVLLDLILGPTGLIGYDFGMANGRFILFLTAGVGTVFYTTVITVLAGLTQ